MTFADGVVFGAGFIFGTALSCLVLGAVSSLVALILIKLFD
jgi:hypothetical protein